MFQHQRGSSGQLHLYPRDIHRMLFPLSLLGIEQSVSNDIRTAFALDHEASVLFQKASETIEVELSLKEINISPGFKRTVSLASLVSSRRMDSDHFLPAFESLQQLLRIKGNTETLKGALTYNKRGQQPIYSQTGYPVINSKHVRMNKVVFSDNRAAQVSDTSLQLIRYGDVLINGTGIGTIGRAAPYLALEPAIPDNHVTILRADDFDPAYLSTYLNSRAGQIQVTKYLRGSSGQIELYPHDIARFLIWNAPKIFQKQIGDMVRSAYAKENEAKSLRQAAIQKVEHLISSNAQ